MNLIDKIYKPFIFARYSLFLKSNKNGKSIFPIDEEYGMLSFFNISTPLWSYVTIVLLLSRRLKKGDYVNRIITKFDLSNNSKYNSFLFCLFLLFAYTVIPIVPIVLYFVLQ